MPRFFLFWLISSLLGWLCSSNARAQDTTLVLYPTMFGAEQQINLTMAPGWVFQPGNNPEWAQPGWNTTNWLKRKPGDLTAKDADQSGRVEGWFRLKIKLDSTFTNTQLGIRKLGWAAADLYVDGRLWTSFGSTGELGKPFHEFYFPYAPAFPLDLTPQREYVLSIHWVDYISPFAPAKQKSDEYANRSLLLFGPQGTENLQRFIKTDIVYRTLWLITALIMTVLFWLLPFQSLEEKKIGRSLAIWGSLTTLHNLILFIEVFQIPFALYITTYYTAWFIYYLSVAFSTIALSRIFGRPLSPGLSGLIIITTVIGATLTIYLEDNRVGSALNVLQSLIVLYLLITSWKNVRGAQWATVIGALISLFFYLAYATRVFRLTQFDYNLVQTGALISIPLSFIVYIILRFKEILADVQQKAQTVVQMTEEKRLLLAAQNQLLEQQVQDRTAELNQSLTNLKATQAQLIQKEKMASLGELTAGIAHEIQNPLNFVNNFSEVSGELVQELKEEASAGRLEDVLAIADDLTMNLQKINHHGKRADSIVKGMLEHSRSSTGDRQLTDLNALTNEYLKLAYHGLRAKDKDFNAELVTHFETQLGLVEVVPQDIGRVLLNLYNNAFYAVQQRQKTAPASYQPTVTVSTHRADGQVEIRVKDNGTGIPESEKTKIFQPFFTTKPTGQGTGLGLSMSYDIITKGHSGSLEVETQVGEGTEMVIKLPA